MMKRKDSEFIYWGEARKDFQQEICDTVMAMMLSPKLEGKGMEAEEVDAYNARVASYNDGILELARNLLRVLEEAEDDG